MRELAVRAVSARQRLAAWAPRLVVALAAVFALRRLDDFDTWWHLASGRWIVEHGAVPRTDILSHTVPDHPWINLQWLYDVALYGLYRIGGEDLLVAASAVSFAVATWLAVRTAKDLAGPAVAALLGIWMVLVAEERFLIRPEMVSFVFLGIVIRLLMGVRRDEGKGLRWLPLVILAWVNCHSLFIVGLFCIACFAISALAARAGVLPGNWRQASDPGPRATRSLVVFGGLSIVAAFVNPYLHEGVLFPYTLLSRIDGSNDAFQAIGEFRRPFSGYFTTWSIGAFQAYFLLALCLLPAAALGGLARPRARSAAERPGFDLGAALVLCGLMYVGYLARRNIGLFAFGATPIVASWVALLGDRSGLTHALRRRDGTRRLSAAAVTCCAVVCGALGVFVASNGYYRASGVTKEFGLGVFEANFPIRTAAFAADIGLPPKLYNDLTAGGYLTWNAGVDGGVFIDGRLEVYDTAFFARYMRGLGSAGIWQSQADQFGVQTVVLFHRWANRHGLIAYLVRDPAWELVYYDEVAATFVRSAGNAEVIQRARVAFPRLLERTRERLFGPVTGWGVPIERATALDSYARLLLTLGAVDSALAAYERLLELDALDSAQEASARYALAVLLTRKGRLESARRHLEIASDLAPGHERVARLLERLGR